MADDEDLKKVRAVREKLPPIVTYRVYRDRQLEFASRYLVRNSAGICWGFLDERTIKEDPQSVGALKLDPNHLEQRPQRAGERPQFLYRAVVHAP